MHAKTLSRLIALGVAVIAVVALSLGGKAARAGSTQTAGWPAAKAQLYDQQQQALTTAQAQPRAKLPEASPAAAANPAPTRQAGIVAMRQGPFSPVTFLVRNFWQGPVGSDWVLAYAGAERTPGGTAAHGAVRVFTESADLRLSPVGTFPAPTVTGPLTIVAENSNILQLRADDGTTFSFSLQSNQYR